MPAVINERSAFNFCDSFDEILPLGDGSLDINDRAQLWGVYALGADYVDIANEVVEVLEVDTAAPDIIIDHEEGDLSDYDFTAGGVSATAPGLNGTNYTLSVTTSAGQTSTGTKVLTAPAQNVLYLAFAVDLAGVSAFSAGLEYAGLRVQDGFYLTDDIFKVSFSGISAPFNVTLTISDDSGSQTAATAVSITAAPHDILLQVVNSSGSGVPDGQVHMYLDGMLVSSITGISFYNRYIAIDQTVVGARDTVGAAITGTLKIDEIYFQHPGALYILGLIRTLAEVVNINEAIIRAIDFIKVIAETINILLIGDSNLVIDHEAGDYDQYDTPPDCATIETPGINSLYLARIQATSITPGIKTFAAPTGIYFSVDFWFDMSCFTLQDAAWHIVGVRIGDGVNGVLWTEIMSEVPDSMRAVVVDDNAATQNGSTVAISRDTLYRCKIIAYKASSGAALDGRVEFYLNSVLVDTIAGLDLFTQFANMTQLEAGLMDEPGMDGYIDLDEINITYQASFAIYILNTIVSKIITEIVTLPETIFRLPSLVVKLVSDTVNVVSGYISAKALQVSDTININSAASGFVGLLKLIAETVNINEVIVRLTGILGQIINETVNINEAKIRLTGLLRVVASETVRVVSGAALRARGLVRVEDGLIRIFEVTINPLGLVRRIAEVVRIVESGPLLSAAITKVIDETINIVSAILRRVAAVRVIAEVVNVNSALLRARGFIPVVGEVVRVASSAALRARGLVRVEDGLLRIFEVTINPLGLVRRVAEVVNVDSGLVILKAIMRVIAEVVNINSGLVRLKGMVRSVAEVVNINSGLVRLKGMVRPVAEVVTVVSAVLNPRGLVRQAAELIRIYEVIAPIRGLVRIVSGTVRIVGGLLRLRFITAIVSSAVNVVESVTGSPVLYTLVNLAKTGVKIIDFIRGVSIVDPIVRGVRIVINQKGVDID